MSGRLFKVAADFPNFERTVVEPLAPGEFDPPPDLPQDVAEAESVRIWGTRKGGGNREQYEAMASGDGLLFYDGETPRYAGVVGRKFQTPWVSRTFWGYAPAELLYTVEEFVEVEAVPDGPLGTEVATPPDGMERVGESVVADLERHHGSVASFVATLGGESARH